MKPSETSGVQVRLRPGGTSPEVGHRNGQIADPVPVPSDLADRTSDTTENCPRETPISGGRPKGRTPLSEKHDNRSGAQRRHLHEVPRDAA